MRFSKFASLFGILTSALLVGCGTTDFGEVDSLSPLIESRNSVEGAASVLKNTYDDTDPEYIVGQLSYVEASSSINAVIYQLILSLESQTTLPTIDESDDESEGSDATNNLQSSVEDALVNGSDFYLFVARNVCSLEEPAGIGDLCDDARLLVGAGASLGTVIEGLVPKVFDAIVEYSKAERMASEERRKELIKTLKSFLLVPFDEIGTEASDTEASDTEASDTEK